MQVRRGAFTAVVVAGSLALAACTGGGESPPSATSSTTSSSSSSTTSSTTTQSPSATKTVALPPEATKHTEAGAKAFARYYWEQVSQSLVTNDTETTAAMSSDNCTPCDAFAEIVRKQKAKGQRSDRSSYDIKIVRIVTPKGDGYVVSVAGNEVPVRTLSTSGSVVETSSPGVFSWATQVDWVSSTWSVTDIQAER